MSDKNFEVIEYNGQPARQYPDGSIRDNKGHLLTQHPGAGKNLTNTAQSLALNERRKEKKHERVVKGANAALAKVKPDEWVDPSGDDWLEALAESQATIALQDDYNSTKAANWLVENAGVAEKIIDAEKSGVTIEAHMSLEQAKALVDVLDRVQAKQVIDGKVIEDKPFDLDTWKRSQAEIPEP